jgi:putative ABC transport system permease protein
MLRDLRFAIRMLLKQPGFSLIAILTLALGIGATSAVFSLIQGVLACRPDFIRSV